MDRASLPVILSALLARAKTICVLPSGVKMMSLLLSSILVLGLAGQPPQNRDAPGDPAKRLAIMKNSMAGSEVRGGESGGDLYRLKTEPVLRFTNTVGDSRDGS